jgi:hypothetical protein
MPLLAAGEFPTGSALRGLLTAMLKECASFAQVAAAQTTASVTFADLGTVGPQVTVTSVFDRALIFWSGSVFNNNTSQQSICAVQISGATTLAADANNGALAAGGNTPSTNAMQFMLATITPGSNTYTLKYAVSGGTGQFDRRRIYVIAP